MENSNSTTKVIGSLIIGAAIGGILGILFAPQKGSKTRKMISGKSEELTDDITEKYNEFVDDIKKEVESFKEKMSSYSENGTAKTEKAK